VFAVLSPLILIASISCGAKSRNADSKVSQKSEWPSTPVYVDEPTYNIWGWDGKTRIGSWSSKSYKLQYDNYSIIHSPGKCDKDINCIHLHIGCNFKNPGPGTIFAGNIVIERHPEHPKTPLPLIAPSYSSNVTVWLNELEFNAELIRSSLLSSLIYGGAYYWTVEMSRELFDTIKKPAEQLTFRIKTDDDKLKAVAIFQFHLSKTYKHVKFMTDYCPRP